MYSMDTVLSLILLVFEMLKIPKTKVEAQCPGTTENLSKYTALQLSQYIGMCTNFLIISYILQSYPSE